MLQLVLLKNSFVGNGEWLNLFDPGNVTSIRNWVGDLVINSFNTIDSDPNSGIQRLIEENFPSLAIYENPTYILRSIYLACDYLKMHPIILESDLRYKIHFQLYNTIQSQISTYFSLNADNLDDVDFFQGKNPIRGYLRTDEVDTHK